MCFIFRSVARNSLQVLSPLEASHVSKCSHLRHGVRRPGALFLKFSKITQFPGSARQSRLFCRPIDIEHGAYVAVHPLPVQLYFP